MAKDIILKSLKAGKSVVTANKAVIARYGSEIYATAAKNRVYLLSEAAVCGGVPIIKSLKEGLIANSISKIYGVFNGTSNFILTSMDKNNLREKAIKMKRQSFINAAENNFTYGLIQDLVPDADMVINLTPDKNHSDVINSVVPLMKKGSILSYSHGFNIVEEGIIIRDDITVIMVAPKCPGTEVREEFKRGFGVPTLIAVHSSNDPHGNGLEFAKAYAFSLGSHKAGVLESSFVAEVKSDLMGEQTILCGVLQTGSILCFDKMIDKGIDPGYASKLVLYGWETITEAL